MSTEQDVLWTVLTAFSVEPDMLKQLVGLRFDDSTLKRLLTAVASSPGDIVVVVKQLFDLCDVSVPGHVDALKALLPHCC